MATIFPDNTGATTTIEEPKLLPDDHAALPDVPDPEDFAATEGTYTVASKERPADADSFTIADNGPPIVFPASLALDLNIKTAMSDDVSKILKELVCGAVGAIPYVGKVLGGLLGFLWPQSDDKMRMFRAFEAIAERIAGDMIDKNNAKELLYKVQGAYNALKSYIDEAPGSKAKGYTFSNLKSHLETMEPAFLQNESPWYSMPYFTAMGTLYLSILREEVLFYEQIYGEPDKTHEARVQRLADTVVRWVDGRDKMRTKILTWRRAQPWREGAWYGGGTRGGPNIHCRVRDERRKIEVLISWYDSADKSCRSADALVELLREWVDTTYAKQVDEQMIGAANLWDLYHPHWQKPRWDRMQRLTMNYIARDKPRPFGKPKTNLSRFDDKEMFVKYGPITRIDMHGSRTILGELVKREDYFLCGLEVFYGGQSSGIRGRRAIGDEPFTTLEIDTVWEVIAHILIERHGKYREPSSWAELVWYLSMTKYGPDGVKGNINLGSRPPGMGESFIGYDSQKKPNPTKEVERLLWFSGWQDLGEGVLSFLTPHFGSYMLDETLGPKGYFW